MYHHSKYECGCGLYEYDSEVETLNIEFSKIDDTHTKIILVPHLDVFTFDEDMISSQKRIVSML